MEICSVRGVLYLSDDETTVGTVFFSRSEAEDGTGGVFWGLVFWRGEGSGAICGAICMYRGEKWLWCVVLVARAATQGRLLFLPKPPWSCRRTCM